MLINESVIQGLIKEAGSTVVEEAFRDAPSPVNEKMTELGEEILKVYSHATNNYGCFDQDTETYRFPVNLREYFIHRTSIVALSKATARLIADRMRSATGATGGYALFLRYENQGRDWLLIVMLKLQTGTGIDRESLELQESLVFDINHLHEAARIDLSKWQNNEQPYLSFIKRSGRQDDVTRYFRYALGCTEYTDSKVNTDEALKAIDAYCLGKGWNAHQKQDVRRRTLEYFEEKNRTHEPVNLLALSSILNDQEPRSFFEYVRDHDFPVGETFEPHPRTYNRLKRISGNIGTIKITYDVQDAQDERIDYDPATNSVIIRDAPESFVNQILWAKGNDAAE